MMLARLNDLISFHQFSLLLVAVTIIFIFNSSADNFLDLFINHLAHKMSEKVVYNRNRKAANCHIGQAGYIFIN